MIPRLFWQNNSLVTHILFELFDILAQSLILGLTHYVTSSPNHFFQSLSQYERLAQTTGDQYENVTIPTTTKIPPKIQEKTRKNSSNLPPMPVRNQAEVSYATLELNPIENPTHGMFIEWRNTTKKYFLPLIWFFMST